MVSICVHSAECMSGWVSVLWPLLEHMEDQLVHSDTRGVQLNPACDCPLVTGLATTNKNILLTF